MKSFFQHLPRFVKGRCYYPVAKLLGKHLSYTWIASSSPVIAVMIAIIAYKFWHIGLKHYGSTGA
jgi:ABC-2 type transport system permease protein